MKSISLFQKLLMSTLGGLVAGATFLRVGNRFFTRWVPIEVIIGLSVFILLATIVSAVVWNVREKKNQIDSEATNAFWIGWLRYGVAFDLAVFGFQKIFHLQFITPLGMLDEPHSSLSGEWLTWSYFGHSYPFSVLIGLLQIGGSFVLLFNRTRLLGLMIILPVLVNIVLIDIFYGLAVGVLLHALIMSAASVYILLQDYDRLVEFFLRYEDNIRAFAGRGRVKHLLRLSILIVPLVLIAMNESPDRNPQLTGKYVVKDLTVNGRSVKANVCTDSLLTLVYLDLENECVFEFNSQKRRLFGHYNLTGTDHFVVNWHFPRDIKEQFVGSIKAADDQVRIVGVMGEDSLTASLERYKKE